MVKFTPSALTLATAAVVVAADDSCSTDLSKSALFGLLDTVGIKEADVATIFQGLGVSMEDAGKTSLGSCVASLQVTDLTPLLSIINGETDCSKLLANKNDLVKSISGALGPKMDFGNLLMAMIQSDKSCDDVLRPIGKCLKNDAIEPLLDVLHAQPCCETFLKTADQALLKNPDSKDAKKEAGALLKKALGDLDAVLCAKRPNYDGKDGDMYCVNAMGPAFFSEKTLDANLLKIPNDKAVDAYEKKEFENVDNKTHTFAAAYSSCAWPIDTFVTGVKELPIVAPLSAFFEDGECVKGSTLAKAGGEIPLVGSLLKPLEKDDTCYHLANGFSKGADWSVVTTLPNGATSDGKSDGKSDGSGSKKGSGSNSGVMASVSATAIAMAVAQFLL
jgi:hypothetical protein